jgi:hypothetical protein
MDNKRKATAGLGSRAASKKHLQEKFNSRPPITADYLRVTPEYLADELGGCPHA